MKQLPLVLAMTGASGAPYALRLLQCVLDAGHDVHLTISPAAQQVLQQELDIDVPLEEFHERHLWTNRQEQPWWSRFEADFAARSTDAKPRRRGQLIYHHYRNFLSPIASGSHLTAGMVICPCSGGTLSGVVTGASGNLIERAAEVHLKERRKLIVVPRETPLSTIYLRNLQWAAEAGIVVLPAMPGWYHGVTRIHDLIDFVVARVLDQLGIAHALLRRWGEEA
jgi:flavin prenyltransferase